MGVPEADPDNAGPALYTEHGATWWPVLWGPAFAAVGRGVEWLTPGPAHLTLWALVAGCLAVASAVWVYGRRRVCSVRLTSGSLVMGRETLPVSRILAVTDVGVPVGARVLGGGWTAPRGTGEVPLRVTGDRDVAERTVLAWSCDPESLTSALSALVEGKTP